MSPPRTPNASPPPFPASHPEADVADAPPGPRLRLDSAWETSEKAAIPAGAEPLAIGRVSEPLIQVIDDDSEGIPVLPPIRIEPAPPRPVPQFADLEPVRGPSTPARKARSAIWVLLLLTVCAGVGVGGVLLWHTFLRKGDSDAQAVNAPATDASTGRGSDKVAAPPRAVDAGTARVVAAADAEDPVAEDAIDAAAKPVPAAAIDAAVADVAPPDPPEPPTPGSSDTLLITSTPSKAMVFVDGAEQGETPVKLAGSADRHSIAVVMPGYALYTADIDGSGTHQVTLAEVTPTNGPAGIKVKCKEKNRYYVFVDGNPTGEMCPTERLGVELGDHTVDVYDLVTESRRQYPAKVKETRNSFRVKVE